MLNTQQNELLQQFLTMPDPTHAQIFDAQAERDDLAEELEIEAAEYESLENDLKDAAVKADDDEARINELEGALADALSIIAGDVLPSDLAETDAAFRKLYKVL
jgi:flagellar motor switch protein FliM